LTNPYPLARVGGIYKYKNICTYHILTSEKKQKIVSKTLSLDIYEGITWHLSVLYIISLFKIKEKKYFEKYFTSNTSNWTKPLINKPTHGLSETLDPNPSKPLPLIKGKGFSRVG
jgi:hypothetical protein